MQAAKDQGMHSDRGYQLPISNIAYHVYRPEDDPGRTQAVSQQAFKRTMDSYHEHEHLADLFQVELDKRDRLAQDRREREKMSKSLKKSSKRAAIQFRPQDQDRSQPLLPLHPQHPHHPQPFLHPHPLPHPPPERHSLRRHLRNSSANASTTSLTDANTSTSTLASTQSAQHSTAMPERPSTGSLKRSRRNSDISTSDISGYGDDDVRLLPPAPKSSLPPHATSSSRHGGLGIRLAHPNEQRSMSSSPAFPLTPSPRLMPTNARNGNRPGVESEEDTVHQSSNQPANNSSASSLAASTPSTSSSSFMPTTAHPLPGHVVTGRRKRKQAIPVHPSVVDRIPGITLRIQREKQGDQLQVEILKNLDDYRIRLDGDQTPASKLQATQDLRKVKDSIESGRPGYAFFPAPSTMSQLHRLDSPDMTGLGQASAMFTQEAFIDGSVDSLAMMTDLFDARTLPLSWENFSTRECVVNKVVGKHDEDLDMLEEVVQDAIARQHYTHQHNMQHEQQAPSHHDRDRGHEQSPTAAAFPSRRPSGASTAPDPTITNYSTTNHRAPRSSNLSSSSKHISIPARATRSRTHISEQNGDGGRGEIELVAHEDIELVLKQKRRKKLEEQRRQGSKGSSVSKDEEDDDNDRHTQPEEEDVDVGDEDEMQSRAVEVARERHADESRRRKVTRGHHTDEDHEDFDGDVSLTRRGKPQRNRQISSMESDAVSVEGRQPVTPVSTATATTTRTRGGRGRSRHRTAEYVYEDDLSSSSEGEDNKDAEDDEDDGDYRDHNYRAAMSGQQGASLGRNKRTHSESKDKTVSEPKASSESRNIAAVSLKTERKIVATPQPSSLESRRNVAKATSISAQKSPTTQPAKSQGSSILAKRPSLPQLEPQQPQAPQYKTPLLMSFVSGDGVRRNKKIWSRGKNSRKEDEVEDTTSDDEISDSAGHDRDEQERVPLTKSIQSSQSMPTATSESSNAKLKASTPSPLVTSAHGTREFMVGSAGTKKMHAAASNPATSTVSTSANTPTPPSITSDAKNSNNGNIGGGPTTQESGGRTRARARSFSNIIETADKTKFFESALDVIEQKRRETLAKKKAARIEAEERDRQEREQQEQRDKEEREGIERQESNARMQQQGKAQKFESSNLPKSSKSLPGRVLRRSRADASAQEGSVDPDCTSCRLELSIEDKALWKNAQDSGEIRLPKTWGAHAILCTTCRLQYLDHHWRCTACFFVPVKEEMAASESSCSRCKAGTWLREAVRPPNDPGEKRDGRRKTVSDIST